MKSVRNCEQEIDQKINFRPELLPEITYKTPQQLRFTSFQMHDGYSHM